MPNLTAELWENGSLIADLGTLLVDADEVVSFKWSVSQISSLDGANVEIRIRSDAGLDLGAVRWLAELTVVTNVSSSDTGVLSIESETITKNNGDAGSLSTESETVEKFVSVTAELWENGVLVATLGTVQFSSEQVLSFKWDSTALSGDGTNAEIRLTTPGGSTADLGAVRWLAALTTLLNLSDSDSGSLTTESESLAFEVNDTDSGTLTNEAQTLTVFLTDSDSGTLTTESQEIPAELKNDSDTATLTNEAQTLTALLTDSDAGTLTTESQAAPSGNLGDTDAGSLTTETELIVITGVSDSGSLTTETETTFVLKTDSDSGTLTVEGISYRLLTSSDTGVGADGSAELLFVYVGNKVEALGIALADEWRVAVSDTALVTLKETPLVEIVP